MLCRAKVNCDAGAVFPGLSKEANPPEVSARCLAWPGFVRFRGDLSQAVQVYSLWSEECVCGAVTHTTLSTVKRRGSLGGHDLHGVSGVNRGARTEPLSHSRSGERPDPGRGEEGTLACLSFHPVNCLPEPHTWVKCV